MPIPRSVYIAFEAFPRFKGASSHIASMVSAMAGNYGPVLLLCLGFGDMPAFQIENNIIIRRFKAYHPNMLKRSIAFRDFVAAALENWGHSLELCIFRDPWGGAPALAAKKRYHSVFEVNALPSWELGYSYPEFLTNYALQQKIHDMERYCLKNADRILTVSPVTARAIETAGASAPKITTIPNSAPEIFFAPHPRAARPEMVQNGRWIGYFGSLHPWQGVETAIQAFAAIQNEFQDINLLIICSGGKIARKRLKKQIRKLGLDARISLHAPLPYNKLAPLIQTLEFTMAPLADTPRNTRQGCCPVKIIESMAAGTPVIASDLACTRALIRHADTGWLFPPGDTRSLALSMQRLLHDRKYLSTLSENARLKAKSEFKRSIIHSKLNTYFDATVNTKGGRYDN